MYRQGDVLIIPVVLDATMEKGIRKLARDDGRIILAYGETTGHAHAITEEDADLFALPDGRDTADGADRLLRLRSGAVLTHEEHGKIELPAGDYLVRLQKEFDPVAEEARQQALRARYD